MRSKILSLINKYRSQLLYLVFGGFTTVVSIGSFALFNSAFGMNELIANVFSWILAVLFAYVTNRKWVFYSEAHTTNQIIKEMLSFFAGRLVTLGIEELLLLVFITWLGFNGIIVKIAAQIVIVILNYVISKVFVFRKK